jgi:peptidoglycan/xylan/chitin deacetylase (PgdA/CDA1 family)
MTNAIIQACRPLTSLTRFVARGAPIPGSVVRAGLYIMYFLGLFRAARYITRGGIRIVCYHGFALADEHNYRSRLFIKGELFRRRLQYLQDHSYPILSLNEALQRLSAGSLPPCATVITMDDGWRGTYTVALPIIKEFKIPVTVYLATYYVVNPIPVYTVTVSYLFWVSKKLQVNLPRGLGTFDLASQAAEAENAAQEFGGPLSPAERLELMRELAKALEVSFDDIEERQLFRVMNEQQLGQLAAAGIDIQLHSHNHDWPLDDRRSVESEIIENRRCLAGIVHHPLEHFCYPSGIHGPHQGEWLAALGVKSATTIEPGLNFADTPRFALRRVVDGAPVSDIEFAAEMSGFMELVRSLRRGRLSWMGWRSSRGGARNPELRASQ